jgi:hypothetical protein
MCLLTIHENIDLILSRDRTTLMISESNQNNQIVESSDRGCAKTTVMIRRLLIAASKGSCWSRKAANAVGSSAFHRSLRGCLSSVYVLIGVAGPPMNTGAIGWRSSSDHLVFRGDELSIFR